mgnify:CR=1 FL=1
MCIRDRKRPSYGKRIHTWVLGMPRGAKIGNEPLRRYLEEQGRESQEAKRLGRVSLGYYLASDGEALHDLVCVQEYFEREEDLWDVSARLQSPVRLSPIFSSETIGRGEEGGEEAPVGILVYAFKTEDLEILWERLHHVGTLPRVSPTHSDWVIVTPVRGVIPMGASSPGEEWRSTYKAAIKVVTAVLKNLLKDLVKTVERGGRERVG